MEQIHANNNNLTPFQRQYKELKEQEAGDALLLVRLGDFYEALFEDAQLTAAYCGIALHHRAGHYICGIPHHCIDIYIAKLVDAGRAVAISEDRMTIAKIIK